MSRALTPYMEEKYRLAEAARKREKNKEELSLCKQKIVLNSLMAIIWVTVGMVYAKKNSIVVPLLAAPSAAYAASQLAVNISRARKLSKELE